MDAAAAPPPATVGEGASYHFGVVRRAIERIDAAGGAELPLETLAGEIGMSAAHFQRVFSRWAGVSPKRYQQYLALGQARALLAARFTVLEAAGAAGLSGPGRLHDLFLRWEAMTPGAYARAGAGLKIGWGRFDSPFGPVLAMGTERGLCGLAFTAETGEDAAFADLAARWPAATFQETPGPLAPRVAAAFGGTGGAELHVVGAPFQLKVWEALLTIPEGRVTSYGEIARAIGRPRAARAVGTAVGRNPLSLVIPCHRVLRRGGALGGYRWGLTVKRAMLAREAARTDAAETAGQES